MNKMKGTQMGTTMGTRSEIGGAERDDGWSWMVTEVGTAEFGTTSGSRTR